MIRNHITLTRRKALKTLAGGFAVTSAAVPVSAGGHKLSDELNRVRKATQQYKDVESALVDGYGPPDPEYIPQMGFHFAKPGLFAVDSDPNSLRTGGGTVDIEEPAILVYFTTGNYNPDPHDPHDPDRNDDLRLGAVEYVHLGDDDPPGTPSNYFSDEDANRNLKTSEADGWHWVPQVEITGLHAWVHRANPKGVFHDTNPTID